MQCMLHCVGIVLIFVVIEMQLALCTHTLWGAAAPQSPACVRMR